MPRFIFEGLGRPFRWVSQEVEINAQHDLRLLYRRAPSRVMPLSQSAGTRLAKFRHDVPPAAPPDVVRHQGITSSLELRGPAGDTAHSCLC